jgi:nicotinate phosphoribosyltransferase
MTPVLHSLLETDLYKFTMWQAMLHRHPAASADYKFHCRGGAHPLAQLLPELDAQLDHLCTLSFTEAELGWLGGLRFVRSDFVDFLRIFRFQRRFIRACAGSDGRTLEISASGPQVHVMAFEIYVLAIVNELYFRQFDASAALAEGRRRLASKIERVRAFGADIAARVRATPPPTGVAPPWREGVFPLEFFDFGARRRYSGAWHDEVVGTLAREIPQWFKGTSNVHLARKHGVVAIGTMAHEYLQSYQAFDSRLRDFQKAALEDWVQEYRGDLGIALTDVVGMDAFLADFDLYFAKLFDGLRHDSGDPFDWGEKALAHYARLRIDARTKRLVFSDGLDFDLAFRLHGAFAERTQLGFGIGTHLTNDVGLEPLNIVMKLVRCNGQPVAKLPDSPGKVLCDDETFLAYLSQVFGVHEALAHANGGTP